MKAATKIEKNKKKQKKNTVNDHNIIIALQ